jgi:hypothetical protein
VQGPEFKPQFCQKNPPKLKKTGGGGVERGNGWMEEEDLKDKTTINFILKSFQIVVSLHKENFSKTQEAQGST